MTTEYAPMLITAACDGDNPAVREFLTIEAIEAVQELEKRHRKQHVLFIIRLIATALLFALCIYLAGTR